MLNTKNLSELLTRNIHPRLCPSLFAMSPNGTLVAYSTPANIKQVRDQAALLSMALKDAADEPSAVAGAVHTLTVRVDSQNVIARCVQPNLFIVLVGNLPPHAPSDFRIVIEREGEARFPPSPVVEDGDFDEVLRKAQGLQRSKLDSLCDFIRSELDGLSAPDAGGSYFA